MLLKERKTVSKSILKLDKNILKVLVDMGAVTIHSSPLQKPYTLIKLSSKEALLKTYLYFQDLSLIDFFLLCILHKCGATPIEDFSSTLDKLVRKKLIKIDKHNMVITKRGIKIIENCIKLFQ